MAWCLHILAGTNVPHQPWPCATRTPSHSPSIFGGGSRCVGRCHRYTDRRQASHGDISLCIHREKAMGLCGCGRRCCLLHVQNGPASLQKHFCGMVSHLGLWGGFCGCWLSEDWSYLPSLNLEVLLLCLLLLHLSIMCYIQYVIFSVPTCRVVTYITRPLCYSLLPNCVLIIKRAHDCSVWAYCTARHGNVHLKVL